MAAPESYGNILLAIVYSFWSCEPLNRKDFKKMCRGEKIEMLLLMFFLIEKN